MGTSEGATDSWAASLLATDCPNSGSTGVPQDYVQAHMWLNLAASRHPPGEDRDDAVKNRDWVAKGMTPAQISEAQKLAREWKPK